MINARHGSQRWKSPPEVKRPKGGRAEAGPGIYLTNLLERAMTYATGSGACMHLGISPNLVLTKDVHIEPQDALSFLRKTRGIKERSHLEDDIRYEIGGSRENRQSISLEQIINLFVNSDNCIGEKALSLNSFILEKGAHASLQWISGKEDWLVVHDPEIITSHERVLSKDLDLYQAQLPCFRDQITQYTKTYDGNEGQRRTCRPVP
ncbi:hypothetical protein [Flexibacterium corallicola]|uniref:hypothetical protein n=1 Tax=Flexibacterium corallicola TaxID=3037259 RepID=UPI00286FAB89|nr:hypothetical protein [Pseudovibrio sp. M1P-2-3]